MLIIVIHCQVFVTITKFITIIVLYRDYCAEVYKYPNIYKSGFFKYITPVEFEDALRANIVYLLHIPYLLFLLTLPICESVTKTFSAFADVYIV